MVTANMLYHDVVCTCSHPTLDPTPRVESSDQAVARAPTISVEIDENVEPGSPDARGGRRGSKRDRGPAVVTGPEALAALARAENVALNEQIDRSSAIDHKPSRLSMLDMNEVMPPASMGSFADATRGDTVTASAIARMRAAEDKRQGTKGMSQRDIEYRHRELVARRIAAQRREPEHTSFAAAAAAAAAVKSAAVTAASFAAVAKKRGAADGDEELLPEQDGDSGPPSAEQLERDERRAAAEVERALERAAAVSDPNVIAMRRWGQPPPARFWLLLGLWMVGGPFGLHRFALRSWRVALAMALCSSLGILLLAVGSNVLHPKHVSANLYAYKEAFTVGALSATILSISGTAWIADGVLLCRLKLHPASGYDENGTPLPPPPNVAEYYSRLEPAWRKTAAAWFVLGAPISFHRWRLRYFGHAASLCALNAVGVLFFIVSSSGELQSAFMLCMFCGCGFLAVSIILCGRDLIQLLRGRLGPRRASGPRYWLLLASFAFGGFLGLHRLALGRRRSPYLFPLLALLAFGFLLDAATAFTGWTTLESSTQRDVVLGVELAAGSIAALTLGVALSRDVSRLLRGTLMPAAESDKYWKVLYGWLTFGLPLGVHRLAARRVSWRLFPILNFYGVSFLLLSRVLFKNNEGDPDDSPDQFRRTTILAVDAAAGFFLCVTFVSWLSDTYAVVSGKLTFRPENRLWWRALLTWIEPRGFFCGLHFRDFGKPYDWQVYSSLTLVGTLTGIAARQFSRFDSPKMTSLLTLAASIGCVAINLARWGSDGSSFRRGSLLDAQKSPREFRLLRMLWLVTGLLCSLHMARLGHYSAAVLTVLLNAFAVLLILIAIPSIPPSYGEVVYAPPPPPPVPNCTQFYLHGGGYEHLYLEYDGLNRTELLDALNVSNESFIPPPPPPPDSAWFSTERLENTSLACPPLSLSDLPEPDPADSDAPSARRALDDGPDEASAEDAGGAGADAPTYAPAEDVDSGPDLEPGRGWVSRLLGSREDFAAAAAAAWLAANPPNITPPFLPPPPFPPAPPRPPPNPPPPPPPPSPLFPTDPAYLAAEAASRAGYDTLVLITTICFAVVLFLWVRDGLMIFCGWVDLGGERITTTVAADEEATEEGPDNNWVVMELGASRRLEPPPHWRRFKTHLGTDYYFDSATECIHYLSASGKDNYAVDPSRNRTFTYDTLEDLKEQMRIAPCGMGGSSVFDKRNAPADDDLGADAGEREAPASALRTRGKGAGLSVQFMAKRSDRNAARRDFREAKEKAAASASIADAEPEPEAATGASLAAEQHV